jgi:hypothetical protein
MRLFYQVPGDNSNEINRKKELGCVRGWSDAVC